MEDFLTQAVRNMRRTECSITFNNIRPRMRHAVAGIVDEAGEISNFVLKADFYNKPVDVTAYKDELGDLLWYWSLAVDDLADAEGVSPEVIAAEILAVNKAKLMVRYPEKYSNEQAIDRDKDAEQEAIEKV